MSAAEALGVAQAAGVTVVVEGDNLVLEAAAPPPDPVISLLTRHKSDIVRMLRRYGDWPAGEWRAWFEERAAIAEYDGGLSRRDAEAQAFRACIDEWVAGHMPVGDPARCAACDGDRRDAPVILQMRGAGRSAVAFHHECWPTWRASRRLEAVAALNAAGVTAPNRNRTGDPSDG